MLKFWTKNDLLGRVCARITENLLSYLKITPLDLSTCKMLQKKLKCLILLTKVA